MMKNYGIFLMGDILTLIGFSVLIILLGASIYYNIKFALTLLRVQDALEDSLDMLDERYESISKVLAIPLFYDSREVRQVLLDIEKARTAVLNVAKQLTTIEETTEPEPPDSPEEAL